MESVEWIFSDHKLHLSMLQLLRDEQALLTKDTSNDTDRDDEIGGMVLAPPPLDGMPHAHGAGSSTEWVVMKLNSINQNHQNLSNEIKRYYRLLRLHDAVICTMKIKNVGLSKSIMRKVTRCHHCRHYQIARFMEYHVLL